MVIRAFGLGQSAAHSAIPSDELTAHDAFNDVKATVESARVLKERSPEVFARTIALADRRYAASILSTASPIFRLKTIAGMPSVSVLGVVDTVEDDSSGRICIDLTIDPKEYLGLDIDGARAWMDQKPAPVKVVRTNRHELVFAADDPDLAPQLRRLFREERRHRTAAHRPVAGARSPRCVRFRFRRPGANSGRRAPIGERTVSAYRRTALLSRLDTIQTSKHDPAPRFKFRRSHNGLDCGSWELSWTPDCRGKCHAESQWRPTRPRQGPSVLSRLQAPTGPQ